MDETLSKEERQKRVFNLSLEEEDLRRQKKSVVGGYNAELKRVKAEIKDLLSDDLKVEAVY